MRAAKFFAPLALFLSSAAALAPTKSPSTKGFGGRMAWSTRRQSPAASSNRTPSSAYPMVASVISYFSDVAQTRQVSEIKGLWWAADQTLFMQTPGSGSKPETYRYLRMVDRNTVRMENVEVNLSAECPDDGTQVDSRVVMQQSKLPAHRGSAPDRQHARQHQPKGVWLGHSLHPDPGLCDGQVRRCRSAPRANDTPFITSSSRSEPDPIGLPMW